MLKRVVAIKADPGFTLVEMITVIAITAIVAAAVAVFTRSPMLNYQDAQRRANLTDAAQTAFSRFSRDLQTALPNSVRVTNVGSVYYLEFLQTRTGGRYRAAHALPLETAVCHIIGTGDGDVMAFGVADTCFRSLGDIPNLALIVPNSDYLVIYNLGTGFTNADAYASGAATGGNKSLITAVSAATGSENQITFQSNTFTLASPGNRFQVVSGPVSYVCTPGTGAAGTLTRYAGYAIAAAQPKPPAGAPALLAQNVTQCTLTYNQNVINQRDGIVSVWLGLQDPTGDTKINLFQQVEVSNEP